MIATSGSENGDAQSGDKLISVAVSHPGKQHSHQLALALEKNNMLGFYITGSPAVKRQLNLIPFGYIKKRIRIVEGITEQKTKFLPIAPFFYFLASFLSFSPRLRQIISCFGDWFADYVFSKLLPWKNIDAVVGYQNGCLSLFKEAKRKGKVTILDAASLHFEFQDKFLPPVGWKAFEKLIRWRKKCEIGLSDHIITLTELAQKTYCDGGYPQERLSVVHLGADIDKFIYEPKRSKSGEPIRFIFVGNSANIKGLDYLLGAFKYFLNQKKQGSLMLVGDVSKEAQVLMRDWEPEALGKVQVKGKVGQAELVSLLRCADCFVLPSRFDSCTMAVIEAFACGLPVILSRNVGVKDFVVEDKNGWIVPVSDVGALAEKMIWCSDNRQTIETMRPFCRSTAETHSWNYYQDNISNEIHRIVSKIKWT